MSFQFFCLCLRWVPITQVHRTSRENCDLVGSIQRLKPAKETLDRCEALGFRRLGITVRKPRNAIHALILEAPLPSPCEKRKPIADDEDARGREGIAEHAFFYT